MLHTAWAWVFMYVFLYVSFGIVLSMFNKNFPDYVININDTKKVSASELHGRFFYGAFLDKFVVFSVMSVLTWHFPEVMNYINPLTCVIVFLGFIGVSGHYVKAGNAK